MLLAVASWAACGGNRVTGALLCGPGEEEVGGECVALDAGNVVCGPGTTLIGRTCYPLLPDGGPDAGPAPRPDAGSDAGLDAGSDAGTAASGGPVFDDAGTSDNSGSEATSFLIDPAHRNAQAGDTVASPLQAAWTAQFTGPVSYPVVANGLVIAAAAESQPNLRALDVATGKLAWGPVVVGSPVTLAYDRGSVFALDRNGNLRAFDELTGKPLWSTRLTYQLFYRSPPVAANGIVYVNGLESGGTTIAVDESDGSVIWAFGTFDGSDGTVAVGGGVVYEAEACDQLTALDAPTGTFHWYDQVGCTGGGGAAPAVYGDAIWERDWASGNIIVGLDGSARGSFNGTLPPSFHGGAAFYVASSVISKIDLANDTLKWSFSGDGKLCTSAVIAGGGGQVFAGSSSGNVYEIDESSGAQRSSAAAGSPVSCGSENQALSLAEGHLFVPAGNTLIAY
jgi:outer membrane protein assembly factor BamB